MDEVAKTNDDLNKLAEQIQEALAGCRKSYVSATEYALAAGEHLLEAKDKVQHGDWEGWLEKHCQVSKREAQRYMKLVKKRDQLDAEDPKWMENYSFTGALQSLGNASNGDEDEDGEVANTAPEDALKEHEKRRQKLEAFSNPEGVPEEYVPVKVQVDDGLDAFVQAVVEVAKTHGRKLCNKALKTAGHDATFVGMVLASRLKDILDPKEHFAPETE